MVIFLSDLMVDFYYLIKSPMSGENVNIFVNPNCNVQECEYSYSSTCLGCENFTSELVDECECNNHDGMNNEVGDQFVINDEATTNDSNFSTPINGSMQSFDNNEMLDESAAQRMQKAIDGISAQITRLENRLEAIDDLVKFLGALATKLNNQPLDNTDYTVFFTPYE